MTCHTCSFCTVAWQLARFQLTRRIARSLGDSWASCFSVCWLCSATRNTTSSTPTDSSSCSPRWILHLDSAAGGGWPLPRSFGKRQQNCLDFCVRNTTCVSAEWSVVHRCWIHFKRSERSARPGVTQFEIANRCNTTSGKRACSSDWITGL